MSVAAKAARAKTEAEPEVEDPSREALQAIAAGLSDELEQAHEDLAEARADAEEAVDAAVEAKETFLDVVGKLRSGIEDRKEQDPEAVVGYVVGYLDAVLGTIR